jgi:urease accessory protein
MTRRSLSAVLLLVFTATAAEAHTGIGDTSGFVHGFAHPFSGLDHILAMVAVGLFAANLGGRALWRVPGAFLAMMAAGGVAGLYGVTLPFVEIAIALSVIVLGAVVALQWKGPVTVAMVLAGFFAIFHGHAHGFEVPALASPMGYATGFILATAALHTLGIGLGIGIGQVSRRVAQIGGGAMALAGVGILSGLL